VKKITPVWTRTAVAKTKLDCSNQAPQPVAANRAIVPLRKFSKTCLVVGYNSKLQSFCRHPLKISADCGPGSNYGLFFDMGLAFPPCVVSIVIEGQASGCNVVPTADWTVRVIGVFRFTPFPIYQILFDLDPFKILNFVLLKPFGVVLLQPYDVLYTKKFFL